MGTLEKTLSHDGSDAAGSHPITEVSDDATWSPEAEQKLVRKIDFLLVPILWLMSLLNYMDRANLGNAAIAGLLKDLQMSSSQFSLAIITYTFGYCAWVAFSNIILSRTRPSIFLPVVMTLWGVATVGTGFVKTYPQLMVVRTLLGALEAGFPIAVTFLFSCWYTGKELGKRASLFMTASLVGGAFGSLIAGGVIKNLDGARGIAGWRWLFIIEGVITIFVSFFATMILPDYPATCKRLSEDERLIAIRRLQNARIMVDENKAPKLGIWKSLVRALTNWRTYGVALGAILVCGPLTQAYFYPALVRGLGYNSSVTAQFMTVPIWMCGFVFAIGFGFLCDRKPLYRAVTITGNLALLSLMGVVSCAVYDFKARYVFLTIMTGALWGGFSQFMAYNAELFQPLEPE
ncbi:hypothetical protein OQA88_5642, partial [Cercophora sp. LCS_1]